MKNTSKEHSKAFNSIKNLSLSCCFLAFALTTHLTNAEGDIQIRGTFMLDDEDPPRQTSEDPVKRQTNRESLENLTARLSLEKTLNTLASGMRMADLELLVDIANVIRRRSLEEQ